MFDEQQAKVKLKEYICCELLEKPDYILGENEALITGGLLDSYSLVQIAVFMEDAFNVYLPDTEFTVDSMDTVTMMIDRVKKEVVGS